MRSEQCILGQCSCDCDCLTCDHHSTLVSAIRELRSQKYDLLEALKWMTNMSNGVSRSDGGPLRPGEVDATIKHSMWIISREDGRHEYD